MREKENILDIMKKAKEAVDGDNSNIMLDLSNRTIHTASIYQDPQSISLAVIIYSLSKIIERRNYREYSDWQTFIQRVSECLEKSIKYVENNNEKKFLKELLHIRKRVDKLSPDFKKQVEEVFRKAEINKASRLYEHGISMQKTAELLGVSIWELAEYAGSTGISEVKLNITMPESERIRIALDLFNQK